MKYNFKNIAFFATAILAMGAFSACSNEIENIDEQQKETKTITFTATLSEDNPLSRTSHEEDTSNGELKLKVKWANGDKLFVGVGTPNETGAYYTMEGQGGKTASPGYKTATISNITNGNKTADFTLTGVDEEWEALVAKNDNKVNIFYGKGVNLQIPAKNANGTFDYVQTVLSNHDYKNGDADYLKNYDFMHATATYDPSNETLTDFTLTHYTAFIKYRLSLPEGSSSEKITEFRVKAPNTTNENNQSVADNIFCRNISVSNAGEIVPNTWTNELFHKPSGIEISSDKDNVFNIYYSMPPTDKTLNKSVTITAKTANGTYTGVLEGLPKIDAGKVYVTVPITMTKQQ